MVTALDVMVAPASASIEPPALERAMPSSWPTNCARNASPAEDVEAAVVSHTAGTAVVTLNAEIDDAVLKETVEDRDYEVTGIR